MAALVVRTDWPGQAGEQPTIGTPPRGALGLMGPTPAHFAAKMLTYFPRARACLVQGHNLRR